MDPAALLCARRDMLSRRLERVARAVTPNGVAQSWIDKELENAVREKQQELSQDSELPVDRQAWEIFATRETACHGLFRDALVYLSSLPRPNPAVDFPAAASGRLALALVEELRQACHLGIQPLVVPDTDESFSDLVQVIRLRFPAGEIWDLPVAAHEFGHFASRLLPARAGRLSFEDCLKDMVSDRDLEDVFGAHAIGRPREEQKRFHLNEYFADMFATYVMGPSFALTSLLLRFDVAGAFVRTDWGHPICAMRAAAILATLEQMKKN